MILALLFLSLAIACRAIGELHAHGKLKWMSENPRGFWGDDSWKRKYKMEEGNLLMPRKPNWYYRLFRIKYTERWFTSTNLTVLFTDGMHLCQSAFFIFLSVSFSIATGLNFFFIWAGILLVHFLSYRLLQR